MLAMTDNELQAISQLTFASAIWMPGECPEAFGNKSSVPISLSELDPGSWPLVVEIKNAALLEILEG